MEDLKENHFSLSLGLMKATITKVSKNHIVYQLVTYAGDSGAAVAINGGHVVAIHVDGVNEAKERIRHKIDVEDRLEAAEASIDALISDVTVAQGCIKLSSHVLILQELDKLS
jgi:hypothetical protein